MTTRLISTTLLTLLLALPVSAEAFTVRGYDAVRTFPDGKPMLRKAGRFLAGTRGSPLAYLLLVPGPTLIPNLAAIAAGSALTWSLCRRVQC